MVPHLRRDAAVRGLPPARTVAPEHADRAVMSGPNGGEPRSLSVELAQHYSDLLLVHADDPVLGACPVCLETRCAEWRYTFAQLVSAGEMLPVGQSGEQVP
jgi:hypothetical protein